MTEPSRHVLTVTCDTTVVIDALKGERAAAVALFASSRAGLIEVAFSTRLEAELVKDFRMSDVARLVGAEPRVLGTTARWDLSKWDSGDVWAGDGSLSTPGPEGLGRFGMMDSDHLEAHRMAGRDLFITNDVILLREARMRGIAAVTAEQLMARLSKETG
jgi:hypothetical protein